MKYYVSLLVLSLAIGVTPVALAGMLDDENANKSNVDTTTTGSIGGAATDAELDDMAAEFRGEKTQAQKDQEAKAAEEKAAKEKEAKEQEEARKKACETAGDSGKSDGERAAAEKKCNEVNVATANPQSFVKGAEFKALGDAHGSMLGGSLSGANPDNKAFTTLTAVTTDVNNQKLVNNLSAGSAFDKANLTTNIGNFSEYTKVGLVDVDEKAINTRYDPAQVVIGGTGTGMVRCNGGSNCPGGKWGVDRNDGSFYTSMNTARTQTFANWDLKQNQYDRFNSGYLVPDGMPNGTTSSKLQVASMFQSMGESMGMDQEAINIAIGTVNRESSFRTDTGPGTSSAWGYGQYVGDTWGNTNNRNNSFNQGIRLLTDTDARYDKYMGSASLQNYFNGRGGAGAYDYTIHYAGSMQASQERINYAINYYNRTKGVGQAFADYAANGVSADGRVISDGSSGSVFTNNGGLGNNLAQMFGGNNAMNSIVQSILGQTGFGGANALMNLLSGNGTTADVQQVMTAMLMQQLSSGGGDSGSKGKTTKVGGKTSKDSKSKTSDSIKRLKDVCGGSLPKSKDALMLMIKSCQTADA